MHRNDTSPITASVLVCRLKPSQIGDDRTHRFPQSLESRSRGTVGSNVAERLGHVAVRHALEMRNQKIRPAAHTALDLGRTLAVLCFQQAIFGHCQR